MRLFFEDPKGQRLAIDTNRREWSGNYTELPEDITDEHSFVNVDQPDDLELIEREIDFNGWNYNPNTAGDRSAPQTSVYTEYLQTLTSYSAATDAGQFDGLARELSNVMHRIQKANDDGYFTPLEYQILVLAAENISRAINQYAINQQEPF